MEFTEPLPGQFTYLGWTINPRTLGPSIRRSPQRTAFLHTLHEAMSALAPSPGFVHVRLLETTVLPPLPGSPKFDVIALIDSTTDIRGAIAHVLDSHQLPRPSLTATLTNTAKFGDTDAHPGPILLNHFQGTAAPATATAAWRRISEWYESTIGVTNSTLLEFDPGTPYLIVNYAAIPTKVGPFMINQLARPSFYRNVAQPLSRAGLRPCPVFAKRWSL